MEYQIGYYNQLHGRRNERRKEDEMQTYSNEGKGNCRITPSRKHVMRVIKSPMTAGYSGNYFHTFHAKLIADKILFEKKFTNCFGLGL